MNYPNLSEEKKLWKKGFEVIGIDEAGRGCLAGPVLAAAILFDPKLKDSLLEMEIDDSKKISKKKREQIYKDLKSNPAVIWGTGRVTGKVIDRINIYQATKLAMERAVNNLKRKLGKGKKHIPFLILDGRMRLNLDLPQRSIVKADSKVFSCSAASVIAKVRRDRLMKRYAKRYPKYGFLQHKGYATSFHCKMLKKHGPCSIHRRSFQPVKTA